MKYVEYEEDEELDELEEKRYKVVSPWKYAWYTILFSIPYVGLIFLISFAFSEKNIHRRNYARSFFCILIIALVIVLLEELGIIYAIESLLDF